LADTRALAADAEDGGDLLGPKRSTPPNMDTAPAGFFGLTGSTGLTGSAGLSSTSGFNVTAGLTGFASGEWKQDGLLTNEGFNTGEWIFQF